MYAALQPKSLNKRQLLHTTDFQQRNRNVLTIPIRHRRKAAESSEKCSLWTKLLGTYGEDQDDGMATAFLQ